MNSRIKDRKKYAERIKRICVAAVFAALAYASTYLIHFKVSFLTFDVKDAIVTIAGLLLGPIYSLVISVLVASLEFVSMGETGIWGFIMDILSTATFSTVCALIYKYKKNIKGAVVGLLSAVFAMTAAMLLFNIFITPIYMGVSREMVISLIPSLFLPFNLVKAFLNAAISLVLYKPISKALKVSKVLGSKVTDDRSELPDDEKKKKNIWFSVMITAVGIAIIALCVVIFIFFMDAKIELG